MSARLDHLVYGAADIEAASAAITRSWGINLVPGGSHAGKGTRNQLRSFEDGSYFELIGPDPDQGIEPAIFEIASLRESRLVTFAVRVDDINAAVAAMRSVGHDPGGPVAMERATPDGARLRWRLTPPTALPDGGTIPFLIDWGHTPHPSETLPGGISLHSFTVVHPAPSRLLAIYGAIGLDLPIVEGPTGLAAVVATPNGQITL